MKRKDNKGSANLAFSLYFVVFNISEDILMLENRFKTELIRQLELIFPGCIILHPDPNEIQGIPDILILYKNKWAALEGKKNSRSSVRPNQQYYVDILNEMSFARFIFPENKEDVLNELQQAFEF